MSDTNDINIEERQQLRETIERRLSTYDRRQIERIMDENENLREKVRRLEDRKLGGDNDFFGNLMIISIIFFALSILAYIGIPPYLKSQIMPYSLVMSYKNWASVAGIGLWVFPLLSIVFFFLKKK